MSFALPDKLVLALLALGTLAACQLSKPEPQAGEIDEEPNDYFIEQRQGPNGGLDMVAYRSALASYTAAQSRTSALSARSNVAWTLDGPTEVGGRITDIEVIPAVASTGSPETWLFGAASGGMWRSTDQGATWQAPPLELGGMPIGDLATAPSDASRVYAGTGEANAGGGSIAYDGMGVYRSDDAGVSWTNVGLLDVGSIGRIAVDPTDADRLFVAAMGPLFRNSANRGVYRSEDGGASWEQVLFTNDSTGAIDLAIHPLDPQTIYAATWERIRRPNRRSYSSPRSTLYKSTDGGDTWTDVLQTAPEAPSVRGRISVAIAPSDPDVVYTGIVGSDDRLATILKSSDGGSNWQARTIAGIRTVPFDWWFNRLVVSPDDADGLWYIGFELNEYVDFAGSWTQKFFGVHVDQHTLWIDPADANRMLLGNDGGLFVTSTRGQSYQQVGGLPITQFYTCATTDQLPDLRMGGTQDNGTWGTNSGTPQDWYKLSGGDGMTVRIDPDDAQYLYTSFQRGNLYRSENGGLTLLDATAGLQGSRRNWRTPFILDVDNPSTLYLGAEAVYRSTDRAANWNPTSPVLTGSNGGSNGITYGTITALAQSSVDGNVLWAGTDGGRLWVSTNRALSWTEVPGLTDRWVTDIATDPSDASTAYVTYSGYRYGEDVGHVVMTDNLGNTWTDISTDLADIPVNAIVIDPASGALFAGTDIGVYQAANAGDSWAVYGQGLPPAVVTDLELRGGNNPRLVAATYGRSMWSAPAEVQVNTQRAPAARLDVRLLGNPVSEQLRLQIDGPIQGQNQVVLTDATGRSVVSQRVTATKVEIDISTLASGTYSVSIVRDGISLSTKPFVKL